MYNSVTVGNNIRKARLAKNYSQDYLGFKLGISQNGYSKIELGYSNLSLLNFLKISEVLGVDRNELLIGLD